MSVAGAVRICSLSVGSAERRTGSTRFTAPLKIMPVHEMTSSAPVAALGAWARAHVSRGAGADARASLGFEAADEGTVAAVEGPAEQVGEHGRREERAPPAEHPAYLEVVAHDDARDGDAQADDRDAEGEGGEAGGHRLVVGAERLRHSGRDRGGIGARAEGAGAREGGAACSMLSSTRRIEQAPATPMPT